MILRESPVFMMIVVKSAIVFSANGRVFKNKKYGLKLTNSWKLVMRLERHQVAGRVYIKKGSKHYA